MLSIFCLLNNVFSLSFFLFSSLYTIDDDDNDDSVLVYLTSSPTSSSSLPLLYTATTTITATTLTDWGETKLNAMQLELSQDDVGMKEEEEEEEEAGFGSGNGGGGGSGGPGSSSLSYHSTTSPSIAPRSMSSSFDEPLDEPFDSPMDEDEVVRRCSLDDSPRLFFVRSGGRNKQPYCASSTAMLNGSSVVANQSTSNRRRIKVGIRQLTGTQPQTTTTTILSYSFNLYCILFPTNRLETNES